MVTFQREMSGSGQLPKQLWIASTIASTKVGAVSLTVRKNFQQNLYVYVDLPWSLQCHHECYIVVMFIFIPKLFSILKQVASFVVFLQVSQQVYCLGSSRSVQQFK